MMTLRKTKVLVFSLSVGSVRAATSRPPHSRSPHVRDHGSAPCFHAATPPARQRRRRRRSESRPCSAGGEGEPPWETFEFSADPKRDPRFHRGGRMMADNAEKSLPELYEEETVADRAALAHQEEHLAAWERLPPELVAEATAVLKPYVQKGRIERMETVFRQRTARTRFLFENPANPSNVWACLRTMDSFGIQHTDLVLQSDQYLGKAALQQKRGMRTAVGSAQWLTLRNHPSTADAVETLRHQAASQGKDLKLYASDLCPTSVDIRTIDWNLPEDHQICIVMGNEERGISNEMRELADVTFSLPMVGFAESFNLSVATAITLAHLSAASAANKGPLRLGDLPEQEINCLMLKGLLHSLPQKRMADALLRKEGIELPKEIVRLL